MSLSSSFTWFSWPMESPAPCSTRRERLEISLLSCEMVSFARASFSCDASTIFHAFSISRFSDAMVFWSSCDSFSAVCTLAALETISELSSRHFLMSRFSLSCDFLSARCSFSYSCRKRSRLLSPTSSVSTSWKSRSKVSNAFDSKPRPSSSPSAMVDHWAPVEQAQDSTMEGSILLLGEFFLRSPAGTHARPSRITIRSGFC